MEKLKRLVAALALCLFASAAGASDEALLGELKALREEIAALRQELVTLHMVLLGPFQERAPQAPEDENLEAAQGIVSDLRVVKAGGLLFFADNMDEKDLSQKIASDPDSVKNLLARYFDNPEHFASGYSFTVGSDGG